eukprot:4077918-Pyramimonas_sp.AAC.1
MARPHFRARGRPRGWPRPRGRPRQGPQCAPHGGGARFQVRTACGVAGSRASVPTFVFSRLSFHDVFPRRRR